VALLVSEWDPALRAGVPQSRLRKVGVPYLASPIWRPIWPVSPIWPSRGRLAMECYYSAPRPASLPRTTYHLIKTRAGKRWGERGTG
jgi:hypothetical protein